MNLAVVKQDKSVTGNEYRTGYVRLLSVLGLIIVTLLTYSCGSDNEKEVASIQLPSDALSSPVAASLCQSTSTDGECLEMTVGDLKRHYFERLPQGGTDTSPALLISLHGLSGGIESQRVFSHSSQLADENDYVLAIPKGDSLFGAPFTGLSYWNATAACCDFDRVTAPEEVAVDDVAFITQIIDDQIAKNNIDPKRVYLLGHSNGAFMSHRLACEASEKVTAIVAIAGVQRRDVDQCKPQNKVSVLQIHGTNDNTIAYLGDTINRDGLAQVYGLLTYPSARATVNRWSAINGCESSSVGDEFLFTYTDGLAAVQQGGGYIDRMAKLETFSGCQDGTSVQFVTIDGGSHSPGFEQGNFLQVVGGFLNDFGSRTTTAVVDEPDSDHTLVTDAKIAIIGLNGDSEVPALESDTYGTAILTMLSDTKLGYEINLFGAQPNDVTGIHIHTGIAGENGDVIATLYHPETGPSFEGDSLFGSITVTQDLLAGDNFYINLHTAAHPGGEIRGQIHLGNVPINLATTLLGNNVVNTQGNVIGLADGQGAVTMLLTGPTHWKFTMTMPIEVAQNLTAAHIHKAMQGSDGPEVFTLFPIPNGEDDTPNFTRSEDGLTATFTFTAENRADFSAFGRGDGRGLYEALIALPGEYYIDLHNEEFPSSVMRGQLQ